jgi:hypothetical protein
MTRLDDETATVAEEEDPALRETERQIARSRERLAASLGALREDLTDLTDWREWVRRRPEAFVVGAFTLGFALGWRAGRST